MSDKSGKNKVKIEGMMEKNQVVEYLENLVSGLKSGTVNVRMGAESVVLHPRNIVEFEMEVGQKKDKEKISLEMSWKTEGVIGDESGVTISDKGASFDIS